MSEITAHVQDAVTFLCITNTEFLGIVRPYLDTKLLPSEVSFRVIDACFRYYDTTKEAPRDHLCDVLDYELKTVREETQQLIFNYIDRISQIKPPNVDYALHRLSEFLQARTFEVAAVDFVKMIDRGELDEARLLMSTALHAGLHTVETGLDLLNDKTSFYEDEDDSIMPCGIPGIDRNRKGYSRGEFFCILAGPKGKKSWTLVHTAVTGLLHGLNVAYYSFEMSEKQLAARIDRTIGSFKGIDNKYKKVPRFYYDTVTNKTKFEMIDRPCITSVKDRVAARKVIKRFGGRIFLKKFPMGGKSILDVEAHLNELERFEKFVPDLIITDYADIMKPIDAKKQTRDQVNETYINHKRLADERSAVVGTASQTGRGFINSSIISKAAPAEDIRKSANVDLMLSIAQTEQMKEQSIASAFVAAARTGKDSFGCGIVMNLDIGQFCTESFELKSGIQLADEEEDTV